MVLKVIVLILIIIGLLGTFIPAIPGTFMIIIAAFIYGWVTQFKVVGLQLILTLVGLSIIAQGSEYLIGLVGAKYYGASRLAIIGSIIGGIVGIILLGPIGSLLGLIIGAVGVELARGKGIKEAWRVGLGTFLGNLGGWIISFIIAVIMSYLLLIKVF